MRKKIASNDLALSQSEIKGLKALDAALRVAAAQIWAEHPNNPKNKPKPKRAKRAKQS